MLFRSTLFRNKEFYTLEIDPQQATYGSNRHIIDSCVHLNKHFAPDFLDCVIFNGVFGFGLNDPSDIEATFEGIYQTLRNRGLFIFGHNTLPETSPCPIDSIEHLKRFRSVDFEPLGTSVLASDPVNQHWFRFYEK